MRLKTTETLYLHGNNPWPLVEIEQFKETTTSGSPITENHELRWHIYDGSGIVATHTNGTTIDFPLKDHLGNPRVIVSQTISAAEYDSVSLSVTARYDWAPFGNILQSSGPSEPQYGFTGQEKDYELGLHNFRARQYDDRLGRFFSVDPQGQFHSPYVYAGNNPLVMVDPDGEFAAFLTYVAAYTALNVWFDGITGEINSFTDFGESIGINALKGTASFYLGGVDIVMENAGDMAIKASANEAVNSYMPGLGDRIGNLSANVGLYSSYGTDEIGLGISGQLGLHTKALDIYAGRSKGFFDKQFGTNATGFQQTLFGGFKYKYWDNESIGYSTTKYLTGENVGSQRIGSLHYSSNGSTFTYTNDHFFPFGDGGDRFRTAAVSFSNSGFTVGTKLFTEDYGEKRRNPENIDNSNFYKLPEGVDPSTLPRAGVLYVGYKGYQVGLNSDKIRHLVQNQLAHKVMMNGIMGHSISGAKWLFNGYNWEYEPSIGYFREIDKGHTLYFQRQSNMGWSHFNGY